MGKLGHRRVLVRSLTASGWQCWESNQAVRLQNHAPNWHISVLRLEHASESPEGSLKHRLLGPPLEVMMKWVWCGARECVFLASVQALLMLPVRESH